MASSIRLALVYLSGFLLAIHFATVSYINSSFLKHFFGDSAVNILYIAGSALSIILLATVPLLLRRHGSVLTFLLFIASEAFAIFGLGNTGLSYLIILLFLAHIAIDPVLYMCLDVNLEHEIKKEGTTGSKRGALLTISNLAWVISPLALAFLIKQNDFSSVYTLSGIALVPLFLIIALFFRNTNKPSVANSSIFSSLRALFKKRDETRIVATQFILNFFFAWMVIYLPLLLNREMGFGWDKIGLIFVIMLLPFLLFEIPAGYLSDKKWGEREMLVAGLIIMAAATLFIPSIHSPAFWIWAAILFATRIGASVVEIASESYFFKHVKEDDTGTISLFRIARPFSYVVAPLIAMPVVYFFSYSASFYFLAFFVILGLFFIPKKDTL